MSKARETIMAAIVATVFPCIAIGLCALVTLQAQSSMSVATHVSASTTLPNNADSTLDLRLVFLGYPKIGVPRSGTAIISETGLSDIHDITFSQIGGELSPNGRFIAYDSCNTKDRGIYLAEADGSKPQIVVSLSVSSCIDVRWSPDSTKLSYPAGPERYLHVFDLVSKRETLIPNTQWSDWHWWSPAGDEIVYGKMPHRDPAGPVGRLLYITDLRGHRRQLTFAENFLPCANEYNLIDTWAPAWSPDGNAIAFTQCQRVFVISPTGKNLRQLPVTSAYSPRWSPDGRWIIFIQGAVCRIGEGVVLNRISTDGSSIVEIGKLPYCGGPFSIAPFNK